MKLGVCRGSVVNIWSTITKALLSKKVIADLQGITQHLSEGDVSIETRLVVISGPASRLASHRTLQIYINNR